MTLEEYVIAAKDEIDAFAAAWRKGQKLDGEKVWPAEMPRGEWDEQLRSHRGA